MFIFWTLVMSVFVLAIYFAPSFVAIGRKHEYVLQITLLNALLGWSFFGWAAALIWATTNHIDENANTKLSWVIISIFLAAVIVPILFFSSIVSFSSLNTQKNGDSHSYSKTIYYKWNPEAVKDSLIIKVDDSDDKEDKLENTKNNGKEYKVDKADKVDKVDKD